MKDYVYIITHRPDGLCDISYIFSNGSLWCKFGVVPSKWNGGLV